MIDNDEKSDFQPIEEDKQAFPTISSGGSGEQSAESLIKQIGSKIGPYKLLSVLGEGGFGIVYLAEQKEPVRRQVALKIIKPGMDSKQVISRFETERQALALLDHSNIAHVFDAGTTESGRPYFVMEHVKGVPITEHCDQEKLSIEERLQLFIQVCEAVQHAHQKGIIHRDIKPSNILVSAQDDKPIPKIIDFGVAKAVIQPLTERTIFTEQGQLIGTLEYMSPEQAELTKVDIDTRSDIYSLGVLLYELLTGALPFDSKTLRGAAFDEILRIIREEDPPRPSTRLSGLEEEGKKVAENRRTQLIALSKRLQKELEWIPLKAMRKEREQRYESASEFAQDIQNYISGNPLIAGPESVAYRLNKFVKRYRALVTSAVVVLGVLVVGLVVSIHLYVQADVERTKAEDERLNTQRESEARRRTLYANRIALAANRVEGGEFAQAKNLLMECDSDLRSWEWEWLDSLSEKLVQTIDRRSPRRQCYSTALTSMGDRLAIVEESGLNIFDLKSGRKVVAIDRLWSDCEPYPAMPLRFSPDGKMVAAMYREALGIWDAISGQTLIVAGFKGEDLSSQYGDFLFLRNETCRVAFGGPKPGIWDLDLTDLKPADVEWWDLNSRKRAAAIGLEDSLMELSPDGRRVAVRSVSDPCSIIIWNTEKEKSIATLEGHLQHVRCLAFSPDGSVLVSGDSDGTMVIWSLNDGRVAARFHAHPGPVSDIVFSPCGSSIASVALNPGVGFENGGFWDFQCDQSVRIWEVPTGSMKMVIKGHTDPIIDAAYGQAGTRLATLDDGNIVRVWDIEAKPAVVAPPTVGDPYTFVRAAVRFSSFTNDGKRLVSLSLNDLFVYDIENGFAATRLRGENMTGMAFEFPAKVSLVQNKIVETVETAETAEIAAYSSASSIQLWDLDSPSRGRSIEDVWHREIAISQDGSRVYCASGDNKTIKVIDFQNGRCVRAIAAPDGVCFSKHIAEISSKRLVVGTADGFGDPPFERLIVMDEGGRPVGGPIWDPPFDGYSVSTTVDGRWLIAVSVDAETASEVFAAGHLNRDVLPVQSKVAYWRIDAGGNLTDFHETPLLDGWALAVSPVVKRVLCVDLPIYNEGVVGIFDSETGHRILDISHEFGGVASAAFSPDGKQIITGGFDGSILLWRP